MNERLERTGKKPHSAIAFEWQSTYDERGVAATPDWRLNPWTDAVMAYGADKGGFDGEVGSDPRFDRVWSQTIPELMRAGSNLFVWCLDPVDHLGLLPSLTMRLAYRAANFDDYRIRDFDMTGYTHHPAIRGDVAI